MELLEENVQLYPRPPAVEAVAQRVRIVLGGAEVASSSAAFRVLETHHAPTYYLPPDDIVPGVLTKASGTSFCEWKGRASYFDVGARGVLARRAAWCYRAPDPAFLSIKDYVAFYPGKMEACFVGQSKVRPQPGDFYGGWVTDNLVGVIKGAAGTLHW